MEIKYGSLEWAVDTLKSHVEQLTKIKCASKKVQKAAEKIGYTGFFEHHIKALTEEICSGCYHSQDSEEYRRTHPEYFRDEQPTTEEIMQMMYDEIPDEED